MILKAAILAARPISPAVSPHPGLGYGGGISRVAVWNGPATILWTHLNCDGLVELDKFPRLRTYFEQHAMALKKRHTAVKNQRGWYKTIDRVTHSLTSKPTLYIADIKNMLDPVLDRGKTYPHHNLYFIQSEDWDLEVLGGLLMSAVGHLFCDVLWCPYAGWLLEVPGARPAPDSGT